MIFNTTTYTVKIIPKRHLVQNVPNASNFFNHYFFFYVFVTSFYTYPIPFFFVKKAGSNTRFSLSYYICVIYFFFWSDISINTVADDCLMYIGFNLFQFLTYVHCTFVYVKHEKNSYWMISCGNQLINQKQD